MSKIGLGSQRHEHLRASFGLSMPSCQIVSKLSQLLREVLYSGPLDDRRDKHLYGSVLLLNRSLTDFSCSVIIEIRVPRRPNLTASMQHL